MGLAGTANTSRAEAPNGANKPNRGPCPSIAHPNKRQHKAITAKDKPAATATRQRSRDEISMGAGSKCLSQRFDFVLDFMHQQRDTRVDGVELYTMVVHSRAVWIFGRDGGRVL